MNLLDVNKLFNGILDSAPEQWPGIPNPNNEVSGLFGAIDLGAEFAGSALSTSSPVGTVVPYAGPIDNATNTNLSGYPNPKAKGYQQALAIRGWLFCDGRAVPVAAFPQLFRAIGFIYGKEDSGHFYLPDFRGRFVRGVNMGATEPSDMPSPGDARDPDSSERLASNKDGWKGDAVGSIQPDALQVHQHHYQKAISSGAIADKGNASFNDYEDANTTDPLATTDSTSKYPGMTVNMSQETRAKNIYMNFIIRHSSGVGCGFSRPGVF